MKLGAGIRKHGFRKWYERELLRSHAHMALTFVCMVGLIGAFEAASKFRSWADQAFDLLAVLVCGGVGLWALRRYLFLLMHAESVAHQADCPSCGTYARFSLVQADATTERVRVRCRQCSHEWTIEG
jgi:predicted Zn finger-like uncharacterized protein